ncbi:unnamed protein product [Brachionus calyciflorus]|uniref:Uncharacterized protein n=1 Tax=Brachionus calyciflorus TaxID=104777 RepID=A0A813QJL0_9BILA|nr:unnamed protein product [Brachionus calyciflorus]
MTEFTAKITNINLNLCDKINGKMDSKNSSLSSSCSSSSYSIKTINNQEHDSGIENNEQNTIFARVSINDQNLQKVMKFNLDEPVWSAKQRVLSTLAKEVKDGLNYGFYLPPFQGRAGKFLDDCRKLREYSLNGPVAQLEFKYKKRVYKFIKINQKELKALNVKTNFKKFLDLVRTNQTEKVTRYLDKGLDPNFHSDLGETPLTVAVSLAEPKNMIMILYNGGAHLDFRSRDSLTPMHKSAIIGNDKAVKTLLELGAFAEVKDAKMLTPLFYAIVNSSPIQVIENLLSNGSILGVKDDNNWEELHHACKLGLSQHLDHLIYYGCDVNAKNNSGNTPLHVCAVHNQENCARILLFRGCSKLERNLSNQTAYDSAVLAGNQTIADLIKNHKENEIVQIKERPFYNTKRRSIYICTDTQSHYSSISGLTQHTEFTRELIVGINEQPPPLPTQQPSPIDQSGSNSPRSRSNSISSDDHGFGSASLSHLSNNSPNIEYAYPRKRLYPSIPNRTFICIKPFKPSQPGEIELKKGDIIELLSVGDSGYWEGRFSSGVEGWFRSDCVEEFIIPKDSSQTDTILVKRKTLFDLLMTNSELDAPRTVVLQKGKKGFGFVLRGAKTNDEKFEPTIECPALQFLESVDKDSNADKAGLKPFDFVLEINNIDVTCKTHLDCVKLIKKTGDTLVLKVYTSKNFNKFASNVNSLTNNNNNNQVYQTPQFIYGTSSMAKSHSYYATSTIATRNVGEISEELNLEIFDGTKSLPNKKKHELDRTLAEYDSNIPENIYNKTKLIADDANAASIRTRVPVRKPGINNGEIFNQGLGYHHKTLSVPNLFSNPVSPNMPPPPPPPPPTVPSISHSTHSSKNRSMVPPIPPPPPPPASNIYSTPSTQSNDIPIQNEPRDESDESIEEPPIDYEQDTNLVMMALKNPTSPLTPRQIKQRNSAKRNSITNKTDAQFLQTQKFDMEFLQTTKDLFLRYPTAKISISVSDLGGQSRQIEIDRQMFEKLYKSQQPQTPVRTTSVLTVLNSSLPSSNSPSSISSASSNYETGLLQMDPPPVSLNEAIRKAAMEHQQKRLNDPTKTPGSIIHRTPHVKNELERALENRLKRLSVLQDETPTTENPINSFPPPPSPSALHKLNENQNNLERVCSPPPPPPPPLPQFVEMVKTTININTPKPAKNTVNNYQLIDPRLSSDFSELIAKKAAEKRAKFQENKPSLNSVTYQPDGTKIVNTNTNKLGDDGSVKKAIANFQMKNLNNNSSLTSTTQTPNQNNNEQETDMNQNQESFINTASKLLEKVKQHQQQQQQQQQINETKKIELTNPKTTPQILTNSSNLLKIK